MKVQDWSKMAVDSERWKRISVQASVKKKKKKEEEEEEEEEVRVVQLEEILTEWR
jgi:hypothetical protein